MTKADARASERDAWKKSGSDCNVEGQNPATCRDQQFLLRMKTTGMIRTADIVFYIKYFQPHEVMLIIRYYEVCYRHDLINYLIRLYTEAYQDTQT